MGDSDFDSDDEKRWCPFGGNVPPPSPSKARLLPMVSAKELVIQRQKFWTAHNALESQKLEAEPDNSPSTIQLDESLSSIQLDLQNPSSAPTIQLSHPGPPRRCRTTQREPDFDPVSFVLSRCRSDPVLVKRFTQTDRKQFLSVLHRGFSLERWSCEERVALAGHLLLLGAIACCELNAAACERQLRSERCSLGDVVIVALAWGVASEDLLPPQDLRLTGITPALPSPWCLTHTLRALTSLLSAPTWRKHAGSESSSERPALADVVKTTRALALCALDAAPAQAAEYVPVFAAVLAAAQPWTEEAVTMMTDALHLPDAHPHSQAWLLAHLVNEKPLRMRMAHRQLHELLASTACVEPTEELKVASGAAEELNSLKTQDDPMSGVDDLDDAMTNLHETAKFEAMEVPERPASRASTVSMSGDLDDGGVPLAGLVRLLTRRRRHVDTMDTYRKFIFLLVLEALVGDDPVQSTEDATELQKLIAWLGEILMMQPAGTCQVDAIMVQSLVATMTSLWQRAIDRYTADVSFMLSQGSQGSSSQCLVR